uniref:Uncharacterized protein n=1 Tax=Graphocephala atropunctata TaxID=36148 RepID=A0A1B6KLV4_9HEMI
MCPYDIVILSETNLLPAISTSELGLHDFKVFRRDRCVHTSQKQTGGGVLIAVRKQLQAREIIISECCTEAIFLSIKPRANVVMFLCGVYIPPQQSLTSYIHFIDTVVDIYSRNLDFNESLLCGDFNLPAHEWTESVVCSNSPSATALSDMASLLNLRQANTVRNSRGVLLDLVFCSSLTSTVSAATDVLISEEAHHPALSVSVELRSYPISSKRDPVLVRDFNRCNLEGVRTELLSGALEVGCLESDFDTAFTEFSNKLEEIVAKHTPWKRVECSPFPEWFSHELKELVIWKKMLHKKYKQTLNDSDYYNFSIIRDQCKILAKSCHEQYVFHVESTLPSNVKVFWSFVNQLNRRSPDPDILQLDDRTVCSSKEMCELSADFFKSVHSSASTVVPDYSFDTNFSISSCHLVLQDVKKKITALDASKGCGPDGIPPGVLKYCVHELDTTLQVLFNASLANGIFPTALKNSYIVPIYKSSDMSRTIVP